MTAEEGYRYATTHPETRGVRDGLRYAMTEVGQFQAYIQEYMAPGDQAH